MSREARGYLLFSVLYFIVLEVLLVLAIIWWPSFEANTSALKSLAAPLPMLADQLDLIDLIGVPAYVVAQHFFKGCNTLGATAAVLFAMNAVAGEVQRGTLEIWISRPVSRTRLFNERFFGGVAAISLPVFLSSATIPALLTMVDGTMGYWDLMECSAYESLFLTSIYSITFLLSALGSQPLKIAFVMLFLCITEFALYMVKTITQYSAYRLVDIEAFSSILGDGSLDVGRVALLLGTVVICYLGGLAAFHRRVP